MAPQFGGVAYASVAAVFILSAYYNVLLAYCIYYIYGSFSTNLPWMQWEDDEVTKLLDHFVKFRKEKVGTFQAFLKDSSALLELYGSKRVPGQLPLPATPPYAAGL